MGVLMGRRREGAGGGGGGRDINKIAGAWRRRQENSERTSVVTVA